MPFPDLRAQTDTKRGTLIKVSFLRDSDSQSSDLLVDLHFAAQGRNVARSARHCVV